MRQLGAPTPHQVKRAGTASLNWQQVRCMRLHVPRLTGYMGGSIYGTCTQVDWVTLDCLHQACLKVLWSAVQRATTLQVLLSGGAFAASHVAAPAADVAQLLALGCALGAVAAASGGSLVAATLAHALYNAAALLDALS